MDSFIDSQGPSSCSWFSSELTLLAIETYSILKASLSNNPPPNKKTPKYLHAIVSIAIHYHLFMFLWSIYNTKFKCTFLSISLILEDEEAWLG